MLQKQLHRIDGSEYNMTPIRPLYVDSSGDIAVNIFDVSGNLTFDLDIPK